MPIGATIGVGVLGAGAGIYGASKAASAQKKAADTAAATELQVANTNNAFAQSMYDQNASRLDPYSSIGLAAGDEEMGLLLGNAPKTASAGSGWAPVRGTNTPAPTGTGTTTPASGYAGPALGQIGSQAQMDAYMAYHQAHPEVDPGFTNISQFHGDAYKDEDSASAVLAARQAYLSAHPATSTPAPSNALAPAASGAPQGERPQFSDYRGDVAGYRSALSDWRGASAGTPAGGTTTPATGGNSALSAWDKFRNSTNYQFRLNQGLEGVNTKYAAIGAIESGAAMKAVNDYAQNFASNELANYQDQLYRQEALGASAASSLAGVGTNLVSQVSANNNNAASASANAALANGQATANQWNNIGGAISGAAGTIGGALASSYHPSGGDVPGVPYF